MRLELKNWLILILLSLIWGSSFMLMKRGMFTLDGVEIFSNLQVGAIRMSIAGLFLLPVGLYHIKKIKNLKTFFSILGVGFFGNFLPAFLFTYAQNGLSSGYTGMLNSFTPVFTILLGAIFFRNRLTTIQLTGLMISITGVALLINSGNSVQTASISSWTYLAAAVSATLCYAISLNLIKYTLNEVNPLHTTALAFTFTLLPALIIALKTNTLQTIQTNTHSLEGLFYISILAIIGTAFAVILFNRLTLNTTTLFASSVTYLIPIVAVIIGSGFGESITSSQITSMIVVLTGIFVANRKIKKRITTS
jgi:drug/metabolite transporter (DMT)-like permease